MQEDKDDMRSNRRATTDFIHTTPFIAIQAGSTLRDFVAATAADASRNFSPMHVRFVSICSSTVVSIVNHTILANVMSAKGLGLRDWVV